MLSKAKNNGYYFIIAAFLLLVAGYVAVNGENIYLQIHDNLDSNITWLKMLKDNNLFWKTGATVPFLGGIDRNYLYSDLKAYTWLHMLLPTFWAVVSAWFLKIAMAVAGFAFLAKVIWGDLEKNKSLLIFCGFLYGLSPTFPTTAFGFASLPLLLGLMILYYKKPTWPLWGALLFYPLVSEFAYFGLFICGYILLFFLIDWAVNRRAKWRLLLAIAALSAGYIITEWRLFYVMLLSAEKTIRDFWPTSFMGALQALKQSFEVFVWGHYHSGSLHTYIVLPVCLVYFTILNTVYLCRGKWRKILQDKFNWLIAFLASNALFCGLDHFAGFKLLVNTILPPLKGFQFSRTLWFNPFLWYFAFTVVLWRLKRAWIQCVLCLLAFCMLCMKQEVYNEIYPNLHPYTYRLLRGRDLFQIPEYAQMLTYKEFYSEKLFEKIKRDVNYHGEWSIAFGMHPAVIEYNGIATLDGYLSFYPEQYKRKFRQLIAPDLEIDEPHRRYFDDWGGRAYIFSGEVGYAPVRDIGANSASLNIAPDVFREMGGVYVFSRVAVKNAADLGLKEVGVYTDEESPYTIYVYKISEQG